MVNKIGEIENHSNHNNQINHSQDDMEYYPLTTDRWPDLETVLGKHGAGGCWCMWWRSTRREFTERGGEGNKQAMKAIVESGQVPGILAYYQGKPVGWCSVAPRDQFDSLNRSPVLKRLDDLPVWSIVCFFIHREWRGKGVAKALIRAAVEYACEQGAQVVEAYPSIPRKEPLLPSSSYMGTPEMYKQAGFTECAQPSQAKMIMRFFINENMD